MVILKIGSVKVDSNIIFFRRWYSVVNVINHTKIYLMAGFDQRASFCYVES